MFLSDTPHNVFPGFHAARRTKRAAPQNSKRFRGAICWFGVYAVSRGQSASTTRGFLMIGALALRWCIVCDGT